MIKEVLELYDEIDINLKKEDLNCRVQYSKGNKSNSNDFKPDEEFLKSLADKIVEQEGMDDLLILCYKSFLLRNFYDVVRNKLSGYLSEKDDIYLFGIIPLINDKYIKILKMLDQDDREPIKKVLLNVLEELSNLKYRIINFFSVDTFKVRTALL